MNKYRDGSRRCVTGTSGARSPRSIHGRNVRGRSTSLPTRGAIKADMSSMTVMPANSHSRAKPRSRAIGVPKIGNAEKDVPQPINCVAPRPTMALKDGRRLAAEIAVNCSCTRFASHVLMWRRHRCRFPCMVARPQIRRHTIEREHQTSFRADSSLGRAARYRWS